VPLSVQETQALLSDDEALIVLDFDERSYAGVITRTSADAVELSVTAKDLESLVKSLRSSLVDKVDSPFDVETSYRVYQSVFSSFAAKLASKKRLSIVTNGALTSIPLQLLVTKNPTGKKLKDVDWFVRSQHGGTIGRSGGPSRRHQRREVHPCSFDNSKSVVLDNLAPLVTQSREYMRWP
jgi:hypothetical protein